MHAGDCSRTMNFTLNDLPKSLRDVAELIGPQAALKLVEHFGGATAVYVPYQIESDHQLAVALGLPAARKLAAYYGGDNLRNIPRCALGLRRIRNAEIRRCHRAGRPASKLALEFGLTERQVWTIIGETRD